MVIQKEKPIHRVIENMYTKGFTQKEIAEFTGYRREHIDDILRQPWAQVNMIREAQRSVQDEIKDFLEDEVIPSLQVIKDIRDDPESPKAVRLAASTSILDRLCGKPNQPITTTEKPVNQLSNAELSERVSKLVANLDATAEDSQRS